MKLVISCFALIASSTALATGALSAFSINIMPGGLGIDRDWDCISFVEGAELPAKCYPKKYKSRLDNLPFGLGAKLCAYSHKEARSAAEKEGLEEDSKKFEQIFEEYQSACITNAILGAVGGLFLSGPVGAWHGLVAGCASGIALKAYERREEIARANRRRKD